MPWYQPGGNVWVTSVPFHTLKVLLQTCSGWRTAAAYDPWPPRPLCSEQGREASHSHTNTWTTQGDQPTDCSPLCLLLCFCVSQTSVPRGGVATSCLAPAPGPLSSTAIPGVTPALPVPTPGTVHSSLLGPPCALPLCQYGGLFPVPVSWGPWVASGNPEESWSSQSPTQVPVLPVFLRPPVISTPGPRLHIT